MNAPVIVRKAEMADLPRIAEAHRESIREVAGRFYAPEIVALWGRDRGIEGYRAALTENGETYFIAETAPDAPALGFSAHIFKDSRHRMTALYVRSAATRQGVGRMLLSAVEDFARGQGAEDLRVEAALSGEAFYRAAGFTQETRGTHAMTDGRKTVVLDVVHMVKNL